MTHLYLNIEAENLVSIEPFLLDIMGRNYLQGKKELKYDYIDSVICRNVH